MLTRCFTCSLVPYRQKSSEVAKETESSKAAAKANPYKYSPFKTNNAVDFALARIDDLANWGRKVTLLAGHFRDCTFFVLLCAFASK